jgi:hypothetical protein
VAKTQGKNNSACIKGGARGRLPGTIEDCVTGDLQGKVAKAMAKTESTETKSCTGNPFSFGASDSVTVNDAAMRSEIDLIHDIFGSDLDIAIIPKTNNERAALCQQTVARTVNKCQVTKLRAFNQCKRALLRENRTDMPFRLQNCMGQDPRDRVVKICGPGSSELRSVIGWPCGDTDLSDAFAGCGTDDAGELAVCLNELANCRLCQALNQADVLNRDCDEFDDGVVNGSCP